MITIAPCCFPSWRSSSSLKFSCLLWFSFLWMKLMLLKHQMLLKHLNRTLYLENWEHTEINWEESRLYYGYAKPLLWTYVCVLYYFVNKDPSSQGYGFSSGHVWMWELDYKESWVPRNWCFWTVVLEKTLESPLDCKEIQPVHPKGDQSWIFIGRNEAEAGTLVFWPLDVKNWLIGKDPDAEKDWGQE